WYAVMQVRAVEGLRRVSNIMSENTSSRNKMDHVAIVQIFHHRLPDLPHPKRQRALLRSDAFGSKSVKICFPNTGGDFVGIAKTLLDQRWTAVDVLDIYIGKMLNWLVLTRTGIDPDVIC